MRFLLFFLGDFINLYYEKINKKLLQNSKNNDIINGGVGKMFKIEPNLPDGVKGNAQWVKPSGVEPHKP